MTSTRNIEYMQMSPRIENSSSWFTGVHVSAREEESYLKWLEAFLVKLYLGSKSIEKAFQDSLTILLRISSKEHSSKVLSVIWKHLQMRLNLQSIHSGCICCTRLFRTGLAWLELSRIRTMKCLVYCEAKYVWYFVVI